MNTIYPIETGKFSGNVYLIKNNDHYVLIDTGLKSKRYFVVEKLRAFGCSEGKLKCILLTHGDVDHCGNAAYLSKLYNCPVGMHKNDSIVAVSGDMFINRRKKNPFVAFLVRKLMGMEKFKPDFYLEENQNLKAYGIDAKIVHTPGHSPGSVTIITSDGACFCGDLYENTKKPKINALIDDPVEMLNSVSKLENYNITLIYPGHGKSFLPDEIGQRAEQI
jgi:glyoxylase-like metal-dependent hydrolase (beta-lactamase superfamily II)